MKKFIYSEKDNLIKFVRNSKFLIGVVLFFTTLCYGIKIFYFDFSIDTEVLLNNYGLQLSAWRSIDRLGLVFTKKLFFNDFNPYIANFLTYSTLAVICILICYLVQRILRSSTSKVPIIIIPILFLTHPILAEQFNFILQSFEVSFAILLIVIALLFTLYYIETTNFIFALLAILLNIWGFLTYQSLLLFYIAGAISNFMLILIRDEKENNVKGFKVYFSVILKYLLIFILSYLLSQLVVFINSKLTGIQHTSYLSRQVLWGQKPISEVVHNITNQFKTVIFAKKIFYNYGFLFSLILTMIILINNLIRRKKSVFLEIFAFIFLILSPFLLTILLGQGEVVRAQMPAFEFVVAFNFYYICLYLNKNMLKKAFITLCFIIAFYQSSVTANLLLSEHLKYEEDVRLANRINSQLDFIGVGNRKNYSLVLLGKHETESINILKGEVLGKSFFEWDYGTLPGPTNRAIGFMRTLGYLYSYPSDGQIRFAQSIKNEMAVWPEKDSIRIVGDLIIIKLSD